MLAVSRTNCGLVRENNEDSVLVRVPTLFAIADGMGGYNAGEIASFEAVRLLSDLDCSNIPESEVLSYLESKIKKINTQIWTMSQEIPEQHEKVSTTSKISGQLPSPMIDGNLSMEELNLPALHFSNVIGDFHYENAFINITNVHVSLETGVPVAFGILTTENIEQAVERAGTKAGNKGADAAVSAIEMVNLLKNI